MLEPATDLASFRRCVHIVMLLLCPLTLLSASVLLYLLWLTQKIRWNLKVSVTNVALGIFVHSICRYSTFDAIPSGRTWVFDTQTLITTA